METLTRQEIIDLLLKEEYPVFMLNTMIEKINSMPDNIQCAFEEWAKSDQLPSIEVEGYSLRKLIDEFQMKTIGAFTTLSWLQTAPIEAKEALSSGYDRLK